MTNEEMAIQIQLGHNEYYNELWENVQRLMVKILNAKLSRLELPNYISNEDMQQELYFAFCNAVQAYDDTKPYKFNSYLERQIMWTIRTALPSQPLREYSYNQTINEDESTELVAFIPDDKAAERLQAVEMTDLQTQVRQAVSELPTKERQGVTLHYLREQSYKQMSKAIGLSIDMCQKHTRKGVSLLRRNKTIKSIYKELYMHYCGLE